MSHNCRHCGRAIHGQGGLTLIELMVALAISLLIVIAAASFFLNSSKTRETQEAASLLQDNARYATEILTKSIEQTGYQNYAWGSSGATVRREVVAPSDGEPDIRGYNNTAAGTSLNNGAHNTATNRVNNSDTLIIRYQGSGTAPGDGSMIDCRGEPQPESSTVTARAYSIFEVRRDSATSEPELRCKYYNAATSLFSAERIVRGVETFQVMYGVDTNSDSFVDKWLNAAEVNPGGDTTALVDWAKVKSVRVGMVLRSPGRVVDAAPLSTTLKPLGANFSQDVNDNYVGDSASSTPAEGHFNASDGRLRKVVTFTVNLRNPL